jgi:hypothetical protein
MEWIDMTRNTTLIALLALSCAEKEGDNDTGESADDALAAELWAAIDGFESWTEPAGWEGIVASEDGTHGPYVQIWTDADTLDALAAGEAPADGSILVKCGYQDAEGAAVGSDGHALTAMQKIEGYDPDHGDWFWAKFDASTGEAETAGSASFCYGCHEAFDPDGDGVIFDDLEAPGDSE